MTRVLVVDDDQHIRAVLKIFLERTGYEVEESRNGNEALRSHRQHPAALMLIDLIMPDKEGLETIREVRRADPNVKIIAMSGAGHGNYLTAAKLLGANAAITKPFSMDETITIIRSILEADLQK